MSYFSENELRNLGLAYVGRNVLLSKRASLYGAHRIEIGDNSRIDDFCVLSAGEGGIQICSHVHLGVMVSLIGRGKISIGSFSTLSGRTSVYSSSDDYSGRFMVNPTVPAELTNVDHSAVEIGRHVIVGCGSVVLPGVTISDGVAIGALSLVKKSIPRNSIWAGTPAKFIMQRHLDIYDLEEKFLGKK